MVNDDKKEKVAFIEFRKGVSFKTLKQEQNANIHYIALFLIEKNYRQKFNQI